jgi:hypothetical protein
MAIKRPFFYLVILSVLFINVNSFYAQQTPPSASIQSLILEDFEMGADGKPVRMWTIIPDRFGKEGTIDTGKSLQVKSWPESYFGKEVPEKKRAEYFYGTVENDDTKKRYTDVSGNCIGMKLAFTRQGYNHVDLVPLALINGKYETDYVPFRGKVKQMDFWVWGSNDNYYMEVVLMDHKGREHRLDAGSIKHVGWKNIIMGIPNYIPQSTTYVSSIQTLRLVKFVIWAYPDARATNVYVYLDQVKYLTDVQNSMYDGYELGNPVKIKDLWDKGVDVPKDTDVIQ